MDTAGDLSCYETDLTVDFYFKIGSLCNPSWPWTWDPPASVSWGLGHSRILDMFRPYPEHILRSFTHLLFPWEPCFLNILFTPLSPWPVLASALSLLSSLRTASKLRAGGCFWNLDSPVYPYLPYLREGEQPLPWSLASGEGMEIGMYALCTVSGLWETPSCKILLIENIQVCLQRREVDSWLPPVEEKGADEDWWQMSW